MWGFCYLAAARSCFPLSVVLQRIRERPPDAWLPTAVSHVDHGDVALMASSSIRAWLVPALLTLLLVAAATFIIFIFSGVLATVNLVSIIYLIPVLTAAVWWGVWPAVLAAIAGALAADFFFYPPLYSFWISDTQNVADLVVFLIVALVSGNLASNLRKREGEVRELYRLSRRLADCFTTSDLIEATQEYLSYALGLPVLMVEESYPADTSSQQSAVPMTVWRTAAATIATDDLAAHAIYDAAARSYWLVRRILLGPLRYIVFVSIGVGRAGARDKLGRRIEAVITEASANLLRLDLPKALEDARIQGQADALRNALVASMSHDLRTPLASIVGAASVLDQIPQIGTDPRARSLVATVHDEAVRLDSDIQNLLAAARITAGMERRNPTLTDPVDMVRAAMAKKSTQLAGHRVEVSLAADLPMVEVQSALVENAIAQLLDNAAKYSPQGSTIKVVGQSDGDWVALSVSDQGVGLTAEESRHVGQRSFRSARHAVSIAGSGLGLWIANAFIAANAGRLDVESAGAGLGTVARIRLPVVQQG